MTTPVVILAGGEGRRIGGGKPLRSLAGRTLLDRALEQAHRFGGPVAIAAGQPDWLQSADWPILADDPGIGGPLGGIAAALRFAIAQGSAEVLTIPVDTPFLPDDLLIRLGQAIGDSGAAVAASDHVHAVCGLWRTSALAAVPDVVAGGRRSLLSLAEAIGYVTVDWPSYPHDPFFNVNTADDLEQAEQLLARM